MTLGAVLDDGREAYFPPVMLGIFVAPDCIFTIVSRFSCSSIPYQAINTGYAGQFATGVDLMDHHLEINGFTTMGIGGAWIMTGRTIFN